MWIEADEVIHVTCVEPIPCRIDCVTNIVSSHVTIMTVFYSIIVRTRELVPHLIDCNLGNIWAVFFLHIFIIISAHLRVTLHYTVKCSMEQVLVALKAENWFLLDDLLHFPCDLQGFILVLDESHDSSLAIEIV